MLSLRAQGIPPTPTPRASNAVEQKQGGSGSFAEALAVASSGRHANTPPISRFADAGSPVLTAGANGALSLKPGIFTFGYNGQFPPAYPRGYPQPLQDKMNQILQNPNISEGTKSRAWQFAVATPYIHSEIAAGTNSGSAEYSFDDYKGTAFSADTFWRQLIQATSLAGPAYADLHTAFASVHSC